MTTAEIIASLTATARENGLRLTFRKEGRTWIATGPTGRQVWAGTLAEVRRVAAGITLEPIARTVRVSDGGSACEFTVAGGKISSIEYSGGIPVRDILASVDLSGNAESVAAAVESAFGGDYKAVIE